MLKNSDILFLFHVLSAATSMKWIDAKMKVCPITYFVFCIKKYRFLFIFFLIACFTSVIVLITNYFCVSYCLLACVFDSALFLGLLIHYCRLIYPILILDKLCMNLLCLYRYLL